jgi:hypothetical protein
VVVTPPQPAEPATDRVIVQPAPPPENRFVPVQGPDLLGQAYSACTAKLAEIEPGLMPVMKRLQDMAKQYVSGRQPGPPG